MSGKQDNVNTGIQLAFGPQYLDKRPFNLYTVKLFWVCQLRFVRVHTTWLVNQKKNQLTTLEKIWADAALKKISGKTLQIDSQDAD